MQNTKALVSAASESISQIDEHFDGYRKLLVECLATLIQTQDEAGTQIARRSIVEREISVIADKITNIENVSGVLK